MSMTMALARRIAPVATRSASLATAARVYPSFTSYGSDSAFQVSPNAPQYTSGGSYLKTKRAGAIMLSWAKAANNSYDYSKKTFFSLSPSEIGLMLELLDAKVSELTISHSTNMNATDDPKKKELHVSRVAGPDGNSMVLLKVAGEAPAIASLNTGEARVFRELLTYSLPRLFGFHSVLEGPLSVDGGGAGYSGGGGNSNNQQSSGYRGGSNGKPADDWPF